jgi:antitoxin HicB
MKNNKELPLAYPAKITHEADGYSIRFRDLKNVFSEGNSLEEALIHAQEVLDILLLDMINDDLDVQKPSPCHTKETLITVSPEVAVPILLHQLRKERKYTMKDVAEKMGVSYQHYQQIESGKNITLNSLKRAAAALGATVEIKFHAAIR